MSQLPRYESYKGSGVQWLGEIPSHWDVKRMKFVVTNVGDKIDAKESDLRYFGLENIESFTGKLLDSVELESEGVGHRFQKDDVLFGKLRPYLAKVFLAQEEGLSSTEALVFRSSEVIYPKFLSYYCLSQDFINEVNGTTFGSKMPRASWDDISSFRMVYPSLDEQKIIADFLDKRIAQVDALIAKQETLLEKLAEQRVALISHAVTKGLNPDVEMKESGVEWLGEVPSHWVVKKLKFLTSYFKGFAFKSEDFSDIGVPLIKASNVKKFSIENVESHIAFDKVQDAFDRVKLQEGDLILSTVGSLPNVVNSAVGQIAYVSPNFSGSYLNQNNVCFRSNEKVLSVFLKYFVMSSFFRRNLDIKALWIANQAYLEVLDVQNISIIFPSLDEQKIIADFLDNETQKIDDMRDLVNTTKDRLVEYRSTLITQVVTGKIDVRNLKVN